MGLDMYLYKKTYVKNWDHMKPAEKTAVTIKRGGKTLAGVNPKKIVYIVEDAGYWRKANQIHNWFVQNVQDGNDDCGTYFVSREKLGELLAVVRQVIESCELVEGEIENGSIVENGERKPVMVEGQLIKDSSLAAELLPASKGFFFGSTEYDQWYYEDLQMTEKMLVEALNDESDADFEYHSSW